MKVLGTILIAITGLVAQMNVAPAATRADVFRGATSQPVAKSTKTNVARGAVSQNNVKSRVANASSTAEVPSNVASRTVGKNTLVPIRIATDNVAQSGVKARATNVQSRTSTPKTSTATTRRSVANRTTLGRVGQLQPSAFNKPTNVSGDNYVQMVMPSELRNSARISDYISLSGVGNGVVLFKKTGGALPNLQTFFKNFVIKGAYSDPDYTTQVIDREGAIVGGTVPGTIYVKLGGEDEQLIQMLADMNILAEVRDINDDAAVVYDMEHDVCLFFKFETSGNDITDVYPVGMTGAENNEGSCDTTAAQVSQMTRINN